MNVQQLLLQRREQLTATIQQGLDVDAAMPHTGAFITRLFGPAFVRSLCPGVQLIDPTAPTDAGHYGGYPWLAAVGFTLGGALHLPDMLSGSFCAGLARTRQRTSTAQSVLGGDDIALLGIADGLARLANLQDPEAVAGRSWLIDLIHRTHPTSTWSYRMRELAGDLLDGRGRLQVQLAQRDERALATEVVLRDLWAPLFQRAVPLNEADRQMLAERLLTNPVGPQEAEEAAIWLRCLDIMVTEACQSLVSSISDTARVLTNIQHGLKRWVWRDKSRRKHTLPSRWQIDDEYDVQSLLWAILYPIYGAALVDEQFLPGWGNVQARADLGITTLKLIIEVKIARMPGDFKEIEEQVAGDVGLYFKDTAQFDRMIVFIYDDCDKHQPEIYESLRNALKNRERIEEVVIVRRPSMLPGRNEREGAGAHST